MQITVQFDALKRTKLYEYAIRFFFGGAISVIAGLLAKKFGPSIGGLFLAFPAIFPASATLVEKHEKEKKEEEGLHGSERGRDAAALDAAGAAMGSAGLMLFSIVVWKFLPRHSAFWVLSGAGAIWFLSSACVWMLRERRHRIFRRHRQRDDRTVLSS
jgi:hypothetical protein